MNVSSVKNLNGETFSAVQDVALTDVVQTNSGVWNDVSAYQTNSGNYLTAHQPISAEEWNNNYDTVTTNSGAWGGQSVPISAGPGVKLNFVNGTLVVSNDETVLWEGTEGITTAFELNEPASVFDKIRYEWKWNNGVDAATIDTVLHTNSLHFNLFAIGTTTGNNNKYYTLGRFDFDNSYNNLTYTSGWQGNNSVPTTSTNNERFICIKKIVGINRKV